MQIAKSFYSAWPIIYPYYPGVSILSGQPKTYQVASHDFMDSTAIALSSGWVILTDSTSFRLAFMRNICSNFMSLWTGSTFFCRCSLRNEYRDGKRVDVSLVSPIIDSCALAMLLEEMIFGKAKQSPRSVIRRNGSPSVEMSQRRENRIDLIRMNELSLIQRYSLNAGTQRMAFFTDTKTPKWFASQRLVFTGVEDS